MTNSLRWLGAGLEVQNRPIIERLADIPMEPAHQAVCAIMSQRRAAHFGALDSVADPGVDLTFVCRSRGLGTLGTQFATKEP